MGSWLCKVVVVVVVVRAGDELPCDGACVTTMGVTLVLGVRGAVGLGHRWAAWCGCAANIQIVPLAIEMQGVFNSNLESVAGDGYIGGTSGLGGIGGGKQVGCEGGGDQAKSETEPPGLGFDERNVGRFVFE